MKCPGLSPRQRSRAAPRSGASDRVAGLRWCDSSSSKATVWSRLTAVRRFARKRNWSRERRERTRGGRKSTGRLQPTGALGLYLAIPSRNGTRWLKNSLFG